MKIVMKKSELKKLVESNNIINESIEENDIVTINMASRDIKNLHPNLIKLLKREIKIGEGKLVVYSTNPKYSNVYAYGTTNHLIGTLMVPTLTLRKVQ